MENETWVIWISFLNKIFSLELMFRSRYVSEVDMYHWIVSYGCLQLKSVQPYKTKQNKTKTKTKK